MARFGDLGLMLIRNVIFDLDGTLVDTRSGIEYSMRLALRSEFPGGEPALRGCRLGPPIREIFGRLCPGIDPVGLDRLERHFRSSYDTVGWKRSQAYPGAASVLNDLHAMGTRLFVATNKPKWASCAILDRLRLRAYFEAVVSPDSVSPRFSSKGQIVAHLLKEYALDQAVTALVGDSEDDRVAASENGIRFVAANYGYGKPLLQGPHYARLPVRQTAGVSCLNELFDALASESVSPLLS
jgi:phosphoglycolate phosphatase